MSADPLTEKVAATLSAEGAGPGNSIHGWRCEYPDRYGPCDCVRVLAVIVADAVREHDAGVVAAVNALADRWEETGPPYFAADLRAAVADGQNALNKVKADAWDEGYEEAVCDYGWGFPPADRQPSPYRIERGDT